MHGASHELQSGAQSRSGYVATGVAIVACGAAAEVERGVAVFRPDIRFRMKFILDRPVCLIALKNINERKRRINDIDKFESVIEAVRPSLLSRSDGDYSNGISIVYRTITSIRLLLQLSGSHFVPSRTGAL